MLLVALICALTCLSYVYSLLATGMAACSRRGPGLRSASHGQGTLSTEEYGPDDFGEVEADVCCTVPLLMMSPAHWTPSTAAGDIMGARETYTRVPLSFSPVERIILTANGNLQRVLR